MTDTDPPDVGSIPSAGSSTVACRAGPACTSRPDVMRRIEAGDPAPIHNQIAIDQ